MGQETTCQGLDLRLAKQVAPLPPLEAATAQEEENDGGVDGTEPVEDLQGPPAIARTAGMKKGMEVALTVLRKD